MAPVIRSESLPNPRVTVGMLQRYYRVYSEIVAAMYAKRRVSYNCFSSAGIPRPFEHLTSTGKFLKSLSRMPSSESLTDYEPVLKRQLIRLGHKLNGYKGSAGVMTVIRDDSDSLAERHNRQWAELLKKLSDVDVKQSRPPFLAAKDIKRGSL